MTLQPVAVLLAGYMLAPREACSAMVLLITVGFLGAPVFTAGSAGLAGSTGGYIVGFLAAAGLTSLLRGADTAGFWRLVVAGAVGMLAMFALGIAWRTVCLVGDLRLAVMTGLAPFAVKAVVELLLTATIAHRYWSFRRRIREAGRCEMNTV